MLIVVGTIFGSVRRIAASRDPSGKSPSLPPQNSWLTYKVRNFNIVAVSESVTRLSLLRYWFDTAIIRRSDLLLHQPDSYQVIKRSGMPVLARLCAQVNP